MATVIAIAQLRVRIQALSRAAVLREGASACAWFPVSLCA
ncbi:hypothetical protein J2801_001735 [Paraburkholderia phenoliruptrix]|nr:hypothetical protein [Paraburkholderia phenoliruptrix]